MFCILRQPLCTLHTTKLFAPHSVFTPFSFKYPISPPRDDGEVEVKQFMPEVFFFDYGVVVFWGMSIEEEQKLMQELEPFEEERLGKWLSEK